MDAAFHHRLCCFAVYLVAIAAGASTTSPTMFGVLLHEGEPVAAALVQVFRDPSPDWTRYGPREGETKTDDRGRFSLPVSDPAGWYRLAFRTESLSTREFYRRPSPRSMVFEYSPVFILRGRVICPGSPDAVSRTRVWLEGAAAGLGEYQTSETLPVPTARDGSFTLDVKLPVGQRKYNCAIVAAAPGHAGFGPVLPRTLYDWETALTYEPRIEIELRPRVTGSIRFEDQHGKPLAGHRVRVYPPYNLGGRRDYWLAPFGAEGTSDQDGIFEFLNVWSGEQEVFIDGRIYCGKLALDLSNSREPIEITSMVRTVVHEVYRGRVTDKAGRPLADVAVGACVYTADSMWTKVKWTKTNSEGRYSLEGLPRRPWGIKFLKPGYVEAMRSEDKSDIKGLAPGDWSIQLEKGPFTPKDVKSPSGLTTHEILQQRYDRGMKRLENANSYWE